MVTRHNPELGIMRIGLNRYAVWVPDAGRSSGRLLDPIADKLLISSALVSLVQLGIVPAWMVAIIIGREFAVSGLRNIAATEGFTIEASRLGKGKMALQVAAVAGLILGRVRGGWGLQTANILLWAVVFFALVSMVQYFSEF